MRAEHTLQGRLQLERVDQGSKSERLAALLMLADGQRVLLRRTGANPFADPLWADLQGQVLRVSGSWREGYFLVQAHEVLGE
jgi:hypothetical protein